MNVGRYKVDGELGRGGFGVVYSAMDPGLGRPVAIKGLLDPGADPAELIREGRVLAGLSHPNIVFVLDAFVWDGRLMIVMEKVAGTWLGEWVLGDPAPELLERVLILEQMADALGHAHRAKVQHRDLKPKNVMVTPDGVAKVLDFGIAKRRDVAGGAVDPSSALRGTLSYMAPEQLTQGKSGFASDVFAFGVVAYELLSGRHPFTGDTEFLVQNAIVNLAPAALGMVVSGLPAPAIRVIEKCLEKAPERRFAILTEVERELRRAVFPLKQAEARRLALEGLSDLNRGDRARAERWAEGAEKLDRGCGELRTLQERLEEGPPPQDPGYVRMTQQIRQMLAAEGREKKAAAAAVLEAVAAGFGWNQELRALQARINAQELTVVDPQGQVVTETDPLAPVPVQPEPRADPPPGRSRLWIAVAGVPVVAIGAWLVSQIGKRVPTPPAAPSIAGCAASPAESANPGDAVYLQFKTTDASSVSLNGQDVISPTAVRPTLTTGYTLVARNAAGHTASCEVTARVRDAQRNLLDVTTSRKDGLRYVHIPAGTFRMGCSSGDSECSNDEKPVHEVRIRKAFWMGQTEVTVEAYKRFAAATGKALPNLSFGGASLPMTEIDWNEAKGYCEWAGLRLPTEAEWEYAARGETTGARYAAPSDVAWYDANSGGKPNPVGKKTANQFKLYDMLGNVYEWTADWYKNTYASSGPVTDPTGPSTGEYRVLRGGSWDSNASVVRASYRYSIPPTSRNIGFGFRCTGELPAP
ncbi:MAG: bifunctional serine/threonine-protein kinase/formylglycine-generating enzyme family protein [Bryobacteraceae bacterium]